MPPKPRRSISRAISRVWCRRPGTATRLIAGRGSGIGGTPLILGSTGLDDNAPLRNGYSQLDAHLLGKRRTFILPPRPKLLKKMGRAPWEERMWQQVYDPFGNSVLSTIAAAIPVVTLLVLIATGAVKTHLAALIALLVAIVIAVLLFTMPAGFAIRAGILGAVIGFFPIGWIVLNVIFMYRLTVEKGAFETLQQTIGGVTTDRRLQLLLIAFAFGAFFEGASGFGTPVAVTAAILIGLGFSPLAASGLSLIANTAPVAYGALGTPIAGLASVTGIDPYLLGAMVGRQLPFFSLIVPAWLIWAFAGWRGMVQVWPAVLVTGVSFAVPQFLISNFINPWIVDIGAALVSMGCLIGFLKIWQPMVVWTSPALRRHDESARTMPAAPVVPANAPKP